MAERFIIIGGVAAGASAATRLRRLNENAAIVIYEKGPYPSFANCGLPYHIGGEIAERSKLIVQTPQRFRERFKIDVFVDHEVTKINPREKTVLVRNLQDGSEFSDSYSELILATGAAPLRPPIPGIERAGLFSLRDIPDLDRIMAWIEKHNAKRGVVVGGGYIGLEVVEQLHRRGLELSIVEAQAQVMAPLDAEVAEVLHREIRGKGIGLFLGDGVSTFVEPDAGETGQSVVVTKSGKRLPADIVILGLGVKPEVRLAAEAGIKVGARGGIVVDQMLKTSVQHVWAAGDCVEVQDFITGSPAVVPLAGPANRQGRIIANNICGIRSDYHGTQGTAILRLFSVVAGCTGANERQLRSSGRSYQAVHTSGASHAGYYPGAKPLAIKLLFSPEDGLVLGAQVTGSDGVDKRIDVIATAIRAKMTVFDLAELELSYAPPFGSAKDPVNIAGMVGVNVLQGLVSPIQAPEARERFSELFFLDVRDDAEVARGRIQDSLHIPLDQLRARLEEVPRNREIVVYCAGGQRAYNACRILTQSGFSCRNLSGAYQVWNLYDRS